MPIPAGRTVDQLARIRSRILKFCTSILWILKDFSVENLPRVHQSVQRDLTSSDLISNSSDSKATDSKSAANGFSKN